MITLDIKYNHYTYEISFNDGTDVLDEWIVSKNGKQPLQSWCAEALMYFQEKYNDDLKIYFTGIAQDCDIFEDTLEVKKSEMRIDVTYSRNEISQSESIQKMKNLYSQMRDASCPFLELRENETIEKNFNRALDNEFEIAVVATMSAGKSTLINSMLGTELLPARNQATTATLARIHDDDEADHFVGEAFDGYGNSVLHFDPLTCAEMEKMNDDNVADIEITGNIVGITSENLKLVLTDTPGTNNSQNENHKKHTYELIKDSNYKPMVLYVLNATQLETTDDDALLTDISDAMREGGRQASERFIFVMNKADEFDPEKESVEKALDEAHKYLKRHNIDNPRIFPCSALLAKNIRKYRKNELTSKEQKFFKDNVDNSIETVDQHFSDKAPVSNSVKDLISARLEDARQRMDEAEQALVYSGIPSVEASVSEYLEKYAVPMKVREALISFSETLKNLGLEAAEKASMAANQTKVEETKVALDAISKILENGKKGAALKQKIDALSSKREIELESVKLDKKTAEFSTKLKNDLVGLVPKKQAHAKLKKVSTELRDFETKFKVDIENIIESCISVQSKIFINEYNKYVSELIGDAFQHDIDAGSILGSLATMNFNSVDALEYEVDKMEVIGTHIEEKTKLENRVRNKTGRRNQSGFLGRLKRAAGSIAGKDWGTETYTYQETYQVEVKYTVEVEDKGMVSYMDLGRMTEEVFAPLLEKFTIDTKKMALDGAVKEEKMLKKQFKASFDELDCKIKKKIEEQKAILGDKKKFEDMVNESKRKLDWLTNFNKNLNEVLNG